MAEVLFCIAEEILKNLGSRALEEIASAWGFKYHLNQLKITVNTIQNVLLDAEDKQADGVAVQEWLKQLATAIYAADDLFDEFNTLVTRKQLLGGSKVTREVRTFFSASNQIAFAFKLSHKIKAVKEELEAIVKVGSDFGLAQRALQQGGIRTGISRDQTHSYVEPEGVIGRDDDKKAILDLLIPSTENFVIEEELSVLPIVGIGGIGKTTIAQVIYNDKLVKDHFELRLWVCISEDFNMKVIIEKILRSATNSETPNLDMDQLLCRLREEIKGKRYLLVLDDVWEEDPNNWESLRVLLKVGRKGSKILVTTRSEVVARITGTYYYYILQGLSEEKSWDLFEKMAFKSGEAQQQPHLVSLGKQIVKKCANVPLAIVMLGRLCRCEEESKWLAFKDKNLSGVMSILKLSYQHLWSPLKLCFSFCALFPKDFRLRKLWLIRLWIAQGFISNSADESQSLEDVAEEYFFHLLERGFFQDAEMDEQGEIWRCKMHDLMHDLAQEEAKGKCKVVKSSQIDFKDNILHLFFADPLYPSWVIPNKMLDLKMLRTFLLPLQVDNGFPSSKDICQQLVTKLLHLRVLDLNNLSLKSLPRSIGNLIHLRYLNLSRTTVESIPNFITNLHNLQTLNLRSCRELKTLPSKIQKLVNLRCLDVRECSKLTHMPSGIKGLTLLQRLPMFIVGHKQCAELRRKPTSTAKLSDLKKLNDLRGRLEIHIHRSYGSKTLEAMEPDITSKQGLTRLAVFFESEATFEVDKIHDEAVLECLKSHCNLRILYIHNYGGQKLPSWVVMDNLAKTVPNLVEIRLTNFRNCQQLPAFSLLRALKHLWLQNMEIVEYIESSALYAASLSAQGLENIFFPSLETLVLENMKNLKGWWQELQASTSDDDTVAGASGKQHPDRLLPMQLSNLRSLAVKHCPNMTFLPLCPNLKLLRLSDTNKNLFSLIKQALNSASNSSSSAGLKLELLAIDDVENLISLSQLGLGCLTGLYLSDNKLQSTEILGEFFITISSSLRHLRLECKSLRSIAKGLEHLTGLESLELVSCDELDVSRKEDADAIIDMPWKALRSSLRQLTYNGMPQLVSLPSGIQQLIDLRVLCIWGAPELRQVPEWISCLSSLEDLLLLDCPKLEFLPEGFRKLTFMKSLSIINCPGVTERCQAPNGCDWPKVQHIPRVLVKTKW